MLIKKTFSSCVWRTLLVSNNSSFLRVSACQYFPANSQFYGTNPGQKSQALAAAKEASKNRQKQINRLRGAMKVDGLLELDLKKNKILDKTVQALLKEGFPKEMIARHLDPKKKLVEMTVLADGPEGMAMVIDCETKHFAMAKQTIQKVAKRSSMRLDVSEGHDMHHYFERKGFVKIPSIIEGKKLDEEQATDLAIEVNAEEVDVIDDQLQLICDTSDLKECLRSLEERNVEVISSRIGFRPLQKIQLDETYQLFYEAFEKQIMQNIDVNFQFIEMTTNFDVTNT